MEQATTTDAAATGLTTRSSEWEILAATVPNPDVTVQTVDPLFDSGKNVFWPCTLQKPEKCAAKDDKGVAVRVGIKFECESVDTLGTKRAPGYVFRPRPYILEPASADQKDVDAAERGRRDLARDMERLGLLPLTGAHSKAAVYGAIGKLDGATAEINLWAKASNRTDDDGNSQKFQNFMLRAKGGGATVGAGHSGGSASLAGV
jgi:hypothetical protein